MPGKAAANRACATGGQGGSPQLLHTQGGAPGGQNETAAAQALAHGARSTRATCAGACTGTAPAIHRRSQPASARAGRFTGSSGGGRSSKNADESAAPHLRNGGACRRHPKGAERTASTSRPPLPQMPARIRHQEARCRVRLRGRTSASRPSRWEGRRRDTSRRGRQGTSAAHPLRGGHGKSARPRADGRQASTQKHGPAHSSPSERRPASSSSNTAATASTGVCVPCLLRSLEREAEPRLALLLRGRASA